MVTLLLLIYGLIKTYVIWFEVAISNQDLIENYAVPYRLSTSSEDFQVFLTNEM